MTVDILQAYKDSILLYVEELGDIGLESVDFAFASIITEMLDEEWIKENDLTSDEIVASLQMYKRAYGELVTELENE